MSSLTNINNNSSVINVGRTTPVNPGQQTADKSIPVVIASDQSPIPVVEQNKIQSEVALSLLGIPRAEVALGIFADVNTYDVNPSEWSAEPPEYTQNTTTGDGWGVKHLPEEAGALVEAPKDKVAVLTSKRFFRYQPGRVSAATFGVKSTKSPNSTETSFDLNPSIRKYGIFDKYDGYYWETRANGVGDNFSVVRRTQSLLRNNPLPFGGGQIEDHGLSGKAPNVFKEEPNALPTATIFLTDNRFKIIEKAFADAVAADTNVANLSVENKAKCKRDMDLAMQAYILDLQYGGNAHSIVNATTYRIALLNNSTAETTIHTQLRTAIVSALTDPAVNETVAAGRVYTSGGVTELARWTINAVTGTGTQPTAQNILDANYGSRSATSTIFDIYSKFYGYLASEYTIDSDSVTGNVIKSTAYLTNPSTLSADEIKYRCLRDVAYIMNGYAEDLEFGGNASTIYNAKRYYFNGRQIYSQTPSGSQIPSGATGEIRRHTFIQKLLTATTNFNIPVTPLINVSFVSLYRLFPNVFNVVPATRTKMLELSNIIIQNFSNEYTGNIEYGSGGNFGDLVVLRDGLIMTHAAAFDPSLLKKTKNVVAKPGFVLKTTASGTFSATVGAINTNITVPTSAAASITRGMTVTGDTIAIAPGTYVTEVNTGTGVIGISTPLTSSITNVAVSFGVATLEVSQQTYVVGQYVNFYGNGSGASANGLTANKLYKVEKVRGTQGNVITLSDALEKKFKATITGTALVLADSATAPFLGPGVRIEGKGLADDTHIVSGAGSNWVINTAPPVSPSTAITIDLIKVAMISPDLDPVNPTLIYINPNTPFVFPNNYFVGNTDDPVTSQTPFTLPSGLFPLLYTRNGTLPATVVAAEDKVGFIDTSLVSNLPLELKGQIDTVNLIYNNWVKQNVDPRYYGVYEFRIPRSRFSTDQLNGLSNKTVYSDFSTGESGVGKVYPGMSVTLDGVQVQTKSVWDIDFTKVTMLKVEFSWYGAVGALFLAYVPVGNGEARWVRVHHLRASNQLKISSLGNATLPITYLVYGGGSVSRLGITDNTDKGYTKSNHIVKYGASYYIDGGDRGTVRLYSFSSGTNTDVYGSKYTLPSTGVTVVYDPTFGASGASYIQLPSTPIAGFPTNYLYFMKAKVLTNSRADQNVQVIWVDTALNRLYLNKGVLNSQSNIVLISNRPSVVFGLKAKENILNSVGKGVRNRVQVYPTKLSTSSIAPEGVTTSPKIKLQLLKTPLYQEQVTTSGSYSLSEAYEITPNNLPLPTTTTPVSSLGYLTKDGVGIYGWFRASVGTVFGYLYREASKYYFNLLETYSEPVILNASTAFLPDGRFGFDGSNLSTVSEGSVQKERLSSVFISTQIQSPIPETGTEVATFFLKEGSDLFDLLSYFDYNKDYLSFPLTNKVESIYLTASSVQSSTAASIAEVNSSLTWEEQ
jgi:hypothetical protein